MSRWLARGPINGNRHQRRVASVLDLYGRREAARKSMKTLRRIAGRVAGRGVSNQEALIAMSVVAMGYAILFNHGESAG